MDLSPWLVMILGLGTVFIGLACLIGIVSLMGAIVKNKANKAKAKPAAVSAPAAAPEAVLATAAQAPAAQINRGELDAAVSASIATYLGTEPGGLRIHSLKPVGEGGSDRKQLSAVIACAIACSMKKEVSAIRITGIKQV